MARRSLMGVLGVLAVGLSAASLAWACAPQGGLVLDRASGPAGTKVAATASGFEAGQAVELRWGSLTGEVLERGTGPSFVKTITIPNAEPGTYTVIAAATGEHAAHSAGRAAFTIPESASVSPEPQPEPGPADPVPAKPLVPVIVRTPFAAPAVPVATKGKTIVGTSGSDRLLGTAYADVIKCGAGNDVVDGGGGNDVIDCGAGNDRVKGGAGNDRVNGGAGKDTLAGASGNDKLAGGSGNDKLSGGSGKDKLMGGGGNDSLRGNGGKDRLFGGSGRDLLFRGAGDILAGGAGADRTTG